MGENGLIRLSRLIRSYATPERHTERVSTTRPAKELPRSLIYDQVREELVGLKCDNSPAC